MTKDEIKTEESAEEVKNDRSKAADILTLRRTAKEVRRHKLIMRIISVLLIVLIALVAIAYAVSYFYDKFGSFTVMVNKYDMINQGLSLSETPEYDKSIATLNAGVLYDMTNISGADLPDNLDKINGAHNGDNAIKDNRNWEIYVSTITVPDSQSLFLMGCITMSGAGKLDVTNNAYHKDYSRTGYGNGKGYVNGQMVRHGDYSGIGAAGEPTDDFTKNILPYDKYERDTVLTSYNNVFKNNDDESEEISQEVVPYIIYKYTTKTINVKGLEDGCKCNFPARSLTANGSVFQIELAENGSYDLPDGFRGIGSLNNVSSNTSNDPNQMYIYSLKGNNSTIHLNMNFYKYRKDYDKYYIAPDTNDGSNYYVGLGLFNSLYQNKYGNDSFLPGGTTINNLEERYPDYKISDLTITGVVNDIVYYSEEITKGYYYTDTHSCAGGLAGACNYSAAIIENVKMQDLTVTSNNTTGGLIGAVKGQSSSIPGVVKIRNCSSTGLTVGNGRRAGGMIGFTRYGNIEVDGKTNGGNASFSFNTISTPAGNNTTDENKQQGVGGIIGTVMESSVITVKNTDLIGDSIETTGTSYYTYIGGVIGYARKATEINVENVNVDVKNIGNNNTANTSTNSGGIIGKTSCDNYDTVINMTGCYVHGGEGYTISDPSKAGGLAGYIRGTVTVDDCRVENCTIKTLLTASPQNYSCGGFFGVTYANLSLKNSKVWNSFIQGADSEPMGGFVGYAESGYTATFPMTKAIRITIFSTAKISPMRP